MLLIPLGALDSLGLCLAPGPLPGPWAVAWHLGFVRNSSPLGLPGALLAGLSGLPQASPGVPKPPQASPGRLRLSRPPQAPLQPYALATLRTLGFLMLWLL